MAKGQGKGTKRAGYGQAGAFGLPVLVSACVVALVVGLVTLALVGEQAAAVLLEGTRYGRYFYDPTGLYTSPHLRPNAIVTAGVTLALTVWSYAGRLREASRGEQAAVSEGCARVRLVGGPGWGRWASALTMCQVCLVALLVSEAFLPYIVDRVARYLAPLLILQLPYALREVSRLGLRLGPLSGERLRRALALAACACWLATSCIQFVGGKDDVLPYRSILTTPQDEVEEMFYTSPVIPEADRPLTGE